MSHHFLSVCLDFACVWMRRLPLRIALMTEVRRPQLWVGFEFPREIRPAREVVLGGALSVYDSEDNQ